MDSGALLDLLGNENRRRILRLLAQKPCYVTEISDYLGVSPKAVIDHLRRLEEAGLVESRTDDQRRKYFHISRNLRLEVNVSPYSFGMKSAYPASASLDLNRCHHITIENEPTPAEGVADLAGELDRLQELERELSLAQRWVQGRIADVRDSLGDAMDLEGHQHLYAEVLAALASGATSSAEVGATVDVPEQVARSALAALAEDGVVDHGDDGWTIVR
ncbi:ArsR/SmtB family transcription factor [Halobacteriaceae archaeon GCM10025711]|jgi:ArsR family transcriptional regulator